MSTPHSRRPRPALFWAVLELSSLLDVWLGDEPGGPRIMGILLRALTAVTQAGAGRDIARQLAKLRAAMDECEVAVELAHRGAPSEIIEDALRRIDEIRSSDLGPLSTQPPAARAWRPRYLN